MGNINNMKETNTLTQVTEFHKTFNVPVLDKPQIPPKSNCELRVNLIQEELNELSEAIKNKDLVEVADALADLQYVLSGTVLEFGMGNIFKELNDEVHRSNMSKTCENREIAEKTVEHYIQKDNTKSHIIEKDDMFIVERDSDNKILKSINYSEANLKDIVSDAE